VHSQLLGHAVASPQLLTLVGDPQGWQQRLLQLLLLAAGAQPLQQRQQQQQAVSLHRRSLAGLAPTDRCRARPWQQLQQQQQQELWRMQRQGLLEQPWVAPSPAAAAPALQAAPAAAPVVAWR
jgi:hypothetical protein